MNCPTESDSWSDEEISGLWPSSINEEYCCIYRVPNQLRRVNPEAYTPQMLLIGPLHYSKKFDKTDSRYVDYINLERFKKKYLKDVENIYGTQTVEEFRKIIKKNEQLIRESYAESTVWIKSEKFVEMILRYSVFILAVMEMPRLSYKWISKRNILFDQPFLFSIIEDDLLLLENQIPFFILTELFEPFFIKFELGRTFRAQVLIFFDFIMKVKSDVKFLHFTDLLRHVRVMTLGLPEEEIYEKDEYKTLVPLIMEMQNADRLNCAGVEFVGIEDEISFAIEFKDRTLTMPCFTADDKTEKMLRNIMALEQSHYSFSTYVCRYIKFLNVLIDTEEDVDLLVKKGVIKNCLDSSQRALMKMVDKLCEGIFITDTVDYYTRVASALNCYYESSFTTLRINLSIATLRRVYFKDLWTGTATVSAVILLVLTLIGTVASVLQATQGFNKPSTKSPSPPAPPRGL